MKPSGALPPDARFKGYREVVIQDLRFSPHNIKFLLERYETAQGGYLSGSLPAGYAGSEYGPELRALMHMLYFHARVPYGKIEQILSGMGVEISDAELCRIVNRENEGLREEHEKARITAIEKADFVQVDDTGARICNESAHTIVVTNPYFCHYLTTEKKDRLSVLQALAGSQPLSYILNRTALILLRGRIAKKYWKELRKRQKKDTPFTQLELRRHLRGVDLPAPLVKEIETACAIAGYRAQSAGRPSILMSDDATNFKGIFRHHQLCWIHEIRHYRTMHAFSGLHEEILREQISGMKALYKRLKRYRLAPDRLEKQAIQDDFDRLFAKKDVPFNVFNEQLRLTRNRRSGLLTVLDHPHVVIHNNESETDLRERVLKRKISYGNQSHAGVRAWDLHLGLVHTTRKLGISYWEFLKDRFSQAGEIPSLHHLIRAAA